MNKSVYVYIYIYLYIHLNIQSYLYSYIRTDISTQYVDEHIYLYVEERIEITNNRDTESCCCPLSNYLTSSFHFNHYLDIDLLRTAVDDAGSLSSIEIER